MMNESFIDVIVRQRVEIEQKDMVIERLEHRERCDVKLHNAAEKLVTRRMEGMPDNLRTVWHSFNQGVPRRQVR